MKLEYTVSREIDDNEIEIDLIVSLYCEPFDRETGTLDNAWVEEVELVRKAQAVCFGGLTEDETIAIERLAVAEMREGRKVRRGYYAA